MWRVTMRQVTWKRNAGLTGPPTSVKMHIASSKDPSVLHNLSSRVIQCSHAHLHLLPRRDRLVLIRPSGIASNEYDCGQDNASFKPS
jgi:hypothetical protein